MRAHRSCERSRAAAALHLGGTMAPFARNDKTVLEIALPALVGFNAGVSCMFEDQIGIAAPRARAGHAHQPRGPRRPPDRAAAGARRTGGWLAVARRCDTREPPPRRGAGSNAPHIARARNRDAHGGRAGPRRAGERLRRAAATGGHGSAAAASPARRPRPTHGSDERATRDATPLAAASSPSLFTTYTFFSLKGEPTGKDVGRPLVDKYGAMIKDGAMAFFKEEYKWFSVFVVLLGGILLRSSR